jgi:hypothetical protein
MRTVDYIYLYALAILWIIFEVVQFGVANG